MLLVSWNGLDAAHSVLERPLNPLSSLTCAPTFRTFRHVTARAVMSADPAVEYVEPNYIYTKSQAAPNNPRLNKLWGMLSAGAGANATGGTVGSQQQHCNSCW
jgi:hypothetical protein